MARRKILSDKCVGIGVLYTDEQMPGEPIKLKVNNYILKFSDSQKFVASRVNFWCKY